MFAPIKVPYGAKMMLNLVNLKEGVTIEDVELVVGEMCNAVKNNYADDGFIAGQVFKMSGEVSDEGSINPSKNTPLDRTVVIITYWDSFEQHEKSHADALFKEKFSALVDMATHSVEYGLDMLWQGEPE